MDNELLVIIEWKERQGITESCWKKLV